MGDPFGKANTAITPINIFMDWVWFNYGLTLLQVWFSDPPSP